MKTTHVRFHIERGYAYDQKGNVTQWSRETLAGAKTITGARLDLRQMRREAPYFRSWRIVRITTTAEVVHVTKKPRSRP